MNVSLRALSWVTRFFWIIALAFAVTCVYSATLIRVNFGEPIMTSTEEDFTVTLPILFDNNGYYNIADFKVSKQGNETYSDKSIKVPLESDGHFIFYISQSKEKAQKTKELEAQNKHKELGISLGYPECCSEFFQNNFTEQEPDLTLKTLNNSQGNKFPFYTNIAARHLDISLLFHFPCSFNCEESVNLAKKHLEIIKKHDERAAKIIEDNLKGDFTYMEKSLSFF